MQVLFVKIVFVFTSLLWCGDIAAASAAENVPVALLRNVCRQLKLCANVSPVSFQLFGMPSAFIALNLHEPPGQFMQRLHGMSSPFAQFTRVGNQVFYSGSFGQTSLLLVVDVLNADTTRALLSATTLAPAGTGLNSAIDPLRMPGRRMLQLLPDGGRLLMDICYADHERICHQVYAYAGLSARQLASALKATLIAANWQAQSTAAGLVTWIRHGRTLQYFLANVNGNTTLYVTAPAILW
ncbi:MAG: hypothetical protein ACREX1_15950 [Advenella sp.]